MGDWSSTCRGCLACGARVLPLGLSVLQEGIQAILVNESPTHICGSARTLLRVAREIREKLFLDPRSLGIQKLFVAGERLSESIRLLLHQEWGGEVVNVYGMAEFDTIASEFPGLKGLVLMPEFEYMVQDEAGLSQKLSPGVNGELLVRENCSMDWHATNDYVEVIDSLAIDLYDWTPVQSIKVKGRSDLSVVLSDGSVLGAIHIEQLLDVIPGLSQLQVQVVREESNEILRIVYRNSDVIHPVSEAHILNTLKAVNVDLADSLEKGVVKDVIFDSAEYSWIVTARGKLPLVVEI